MLPAGHWHRDRYKQIQAKILLCMHVRWVCLPISTKFVSSSGIRMDSQPQAKVATMKVVTPRVVIRHLRMYMCLLITATQLLMLLLLLAGVSSCCAHLSLNVYMNIYIPICGYISSLFCSMFLFDINFCYFVSTLFTFIVKQFVAKSLHLSVGIRSIDHSNWHS